MGPAVKRVGWEKALEAALKERKPFRWGSRDCCLWAAGVVRAMTGQDYAAAWRGYRTKAQAEAIKAANGGVEGLLFQALGDDIPVTRAQRGDVVLIRHGEFQAAGVIAFDGRVAVQGRRGIEFLPRAAATRAWRV